MGDVMKNKKGFTLIEILAAIIILGVVLLIGVSAISDYIESSRKSSLVATANSYIEEVRGLRATDSLVQSPKNAEALLIPLSEIEIDGNNDLKTPYGNIILEKSYVIVENENEDFNYYISILDDTNHAIVFEDSNLLNNNSITTSKTEIEKMKQITAIKQNLEYIELNDKLYYVSSKNIENSSTVLLDCDALASFTVEINEDWENDNKTITVNMVKEVEGYQYYISERSSKPLKSDSNWQDDNKFVKDRGTYYVFIKNETGEISSGKKVVVDKIDRGIPTCALKATGEMSTEEYFGTDVIISFASYQDVNTDDLQVSGIKDYGIGSSTGNRFIVQTEDSVDGITYTGYIEDRAGNIGTCSITVKRKAEFVLTYNNNGGSGCTTKAVIYNNAIGDLCIPTRSGYSFMGWFSNESLTNSINSSTIFKNEYTDVYAKWKANNYKVTFNANGGSVGTSNITVTYDSAYGTLPNPTRSGYTFKGWYTDVAEGTLISNTTIVSTAKDHTLYARWTPNIYALTYNNNGGTGCTNKQVTYNSDYGTLCTPTRTGYYFLGWYTAASGGTQISSSTVFKNAFNTTIYAHWEYVSVPIVTYNSGSNTCSWKNNYNITLTSTPETGIAYYEIDVNGDGIVDSTTGANFIPLNGYSSCTIRFRAVSNVGNRSGWTENQHIHMDTENPKHTNWWWGEVNRYVARLYIQVSDNVGINRVQCPTSTATGGYTNWYWFNAVWDASANAYRCDITPSTFNHYNQSYITHLYIYDHAGNGGYYNQTSVSIPSNIYTISFNGYGNTGGSTASITCDPTVGCTLPANGFTKTNYAFAGWSKTPGGSIVYANGQTVYETSNLTLYAVWVQSVVNFGYTGGIQTYTIPYTGTYRLEVWGAQGGNNGGYGGYSIGNSYLQAGKTLYIGVGGAGQITLGGFNGGGNGASGETNLNTSGGGGGGATHIALYTNRGILSNYNSYRGEIAIVAGGGGGSGGNYEGGTMTVPGGSGGGTAGTSSIKTGKCTVSVASGGTQTTGYSFGNGQSARKGTASNCGAEGNGGGGGGYFGGYAITWSGVNSDSGGGGGSGYIGGVSSGSMQTGVRAGHGYARITFIGQ